MHVLLLSANDIADDARPVGHFCKGDSGGPLLVRGADASKDYQIGIVSWATKGCGNPGEGCKLSCGGVLGRRYMMRHSPI